MREATLSVIGTALQMGLDGVGGGSLPDVGAGGWGYVN